MKKRLFTLGLAAALLLSGCGGDKAPETTAAPTEHTHVAGSVYEWNGTEHWFACECGEKMDVAAHNVGEDMRCADCGLEIWVMDDGCIDVTAYDEYGNYRKFVSYDADGSIISQNEYEYEYDDQGNVLCIRYLSEGVLQEQDEYMVNAEGESVMQKNTRYAEDGELYITDYNENGDIIHWTGYDADGNVYSESWSEYALDEDGNTYECAHVEIYNGEKVVAQYNRYEDITFRQMFDVEGNLTAESTWEYGYNEEGQWEWVKEYRSGMLIQEITNYAVMETEDYSMRYPETIIDYFEDGTKLVTFNGSNGEPETETLYHADGTVNTVTRYVYETFEDGNWKQIQVYENDCLVRDTQYVQDEEFGFSMKSSMTEYHADGTYTVSEFDENEEVISETTFDANGNAL